MSQFRRAEITRTLNQMREGLTFVRKQAHKEHGTDETYEAALHATSFAAAFIDLVGGMAADLNQICEILEKQDLKDSK